MRQLLRQGFTLIEVLVVVAIIALLIAILMPSLSRAKAMARMIQCQSNMKQLATAASVYSNESKGRLPGQVDEGADWLGHNNKSGVTGSLPGRNPDDGVIFKHMGKNKLAYACPDDNFPREYVSNPQDSRYSYTTLGLIDGAPVEWLAGAHYRKNRDPNNSSNFSETDHTADMQAFDGVPIFVEEDPTNYLVYVNDSSWGNDDCVAARHMGGGSNPGYGNVSYHDTHVGRVQLLPRVAAKGGQQSFRTKSMCIRTTGRKWISGKGWGGVHYGYVTKAPPAEDPAFGVKHH